MLKTCARGPRFCMVEKYTLGGRCYHPHANSHDRYRAEMLTGVELASHADGKLGQEKAPTPILPMPNLAPRTESRVRGRH
jgi:hypothetical protein